MKQAIEKIEAIIEWTGGLARMCVLAMVLLIAFDVILRYFFSLGPVSLQEMEWHLLSPIALIGLSYAMKHKADVRVDFLYDHFGPRTKALADILAGLLTFGVACLIVWLAIPYVYRSYELLEGSPDPGGLPYRYLLKMFIPIGFSLMALQAVAVTMASVLEFKQAIGGKNG